MNKLIIPVCRYCKCSEEECLGDVLIEDKCKLVICVKCLHLHEREACEICGVKIKDHRKRMKNIFAKECMEEGAKLFEREKDKRGRWLELQVINHEVSNLLAFFYSHDRQFYEASIREIKTIQGRQFKSVIDHEDTSQKDFLNLKETDGGDGSLPCGAPTAYTKGILQIFQAFKRLNLS